MQQPAGCKMPPWRAIAVVAAYRAMNDGVSTPGVLLSTCATEVVHMGQCRGTSRCSGARGASMTVRLGVHHWTGLQGSTHAKVTAMDGTLSNMHQLSHMLVSTPQSSRTSIRPATKLSH